MVKLDKVLTVPIRLPYINPDTVALPAKIFAAVKSVAWPAAVVTDNPPVLVLEETLVLPTNNDVALK